MKLLHNARIHTLDRAKPTASALAIENGKIHDLGGEELFGKYKKSECEDMGGRIILPGLTDAHIHLELYAGVLNTVNCDVESKEEILNRVSERARQTPTGKWVLGHGWNQNTWGGAWPSAADLDGAAPNNPVFLTAKSLHASWANTEALKLAGITDSRQGSVSGLLQSGSSGSPTGIFLENEDRPIRKVIPEISPTDLASSLRKVIPSLWRMGLTGVHDFDGRTCFQALQILNENNELLFRVIKSIPLDLLPQAAALGIRTGFGDDFLRIGSVKLFADGALGPRTGAMIEAYVDEPQNRGILFIDREQLLQFGRQAADNGISLAVHAIGDRAVHEVLEGFTLLRAYEHENGFPALRHRIEHVQTIHPNDASRLSKLNLIASMQPIHAPSDMYVAEKALGKRAAFSYAWRTHLQNGTRLVFGSDAPVESPNPFLGLHAAVTRCRVDGSPAADGWYPEQRLTVGESLEAFTTGAAYAAGMDQYLGRLSVDYLADLIVLEIDPFTCDPADLYSIQPVATMVGGEWVWQK
jgi:predicted amidohydrolase YtcJ